MCRLLFLLVPVMFLLVIAAPASAATWEVPGEAPTIQAGIDSASVGDTVLVAPGEYYQNLIMKSGTYVIGEAAEPESTIVYPGGSGSVVKFIGLAMPAYMNGFTIAGGSTGYGGGVHCFNCSSEVANCRIIENGASNNGGGIYSDFFATPTFTDCVIAGNTSGNNGAAFMGQASSNTTFENCTFYGNGASGSGVLYLDNASADIRNSIIAFGTSGGAVQCAGTGSATLSCSDVYGNAGGDWAGCIAGQSGINGNFSADPLFCDAAGGVFQLNEASPCLDAPGCGLVGALGPGCRFPKIWVVPDDAPTIQAGIDSSIAADTVLVRCGTYHERLAVKPGISLMSETGEADCVTIDGESLGTVVSCYFATDSTIYIEGFTITGGAGYVGGGVACSLSKVILYDCVITGNTATSHGGGVSGRAYPVYMERCEISGNTAGGDGGGIFTNYANLGLADCLVAANACGSEGGGIATNHSNVNLQSCIVSKNTAGTSGGGALFLDTHSLTIDLCTFNGNNAPLGSGMYIAAVPYPIVSSTIIAFGSGGYALHCVSVNSVILTCSDIYGNEGGDYVQCLAGKDTTGNNIWGDPIFCDPDNGDFHIASASPCIGQPCWQMGALGVGCEDPMLSILGIQDVGNDQGRNARLTWRRSRYDAPISPLDITGYEVYRRQGGQLTRGKPTATNSPPVLKAIGWDYLETVPAHGDSCYHYVAPTLCDSTSAGICWSVFVIRAASTDPFVYMDSEPDSGYSVDNLAPSPPPGLNMPAATDLAWDEVSDEDFDYYSVYGSALDLLDETATRIGHTIDLTMDVTGHVYAYYHVTATDFSGNEGKASSVGNPFAGLPDLPDDDDIPTAFALKQNRPNPFSTTTVIAFDLPEETNARIRIYDTHGRLIKRLIDTHYEAGRHAATWRGEDETGRLVSPGVYFIRMEAGEFRDMKKVMLLR